MSLLRIASVFALAVLGAGCQGDADSAGGDASAGTPRSQEASAGLVTQRSLVDIDWVAESIAGEPVLEGVPVTIRFEPEGAVSGVAGCNSYEGAYVVVRERIQYGSLVVTELACPGPIGEQEERFFAALATAVTVRLVEGVLVMEPTEGGSETRFARFSEP